MKAQFAKIATAARSGLRRAGQHVRSKLIWWSCGLMNWLWDHLRYDDPSAPIGWRDHLRWWIEGMLSRVFSAAYEGSDEEVRDGVEFALDGVNPIYLSKRQREIRSRLCEWVDVEEEG